MRESRLEAKISKYAKSKGCLSYKWSSPSQRGVPDRIIVAPNGKVLFLEVKALGEKPTKLQLHEIAKLTAQGCTAYWVDNFSDATVRIGQLTNWK
jgi:Holliday junction resolvase